MDFDPDRIYHKLSEMGRSWADKESAAELLEETKKTVLAELTIGFQKDAKSRIEAETEALASEAYEEHIKAMVEARRQANRARVDYDCGKTLAELKRSQESTKRAEMALR